VIEVIADIKRMPWDDIEIRTFGSRPEIHRIPVHLRQWTLTESMIQDDVLDHSTAPLMSGVDECFQLISGAIIFIYGHVK
jgi:hypothetical protein